jgi:hypothetical protein
MPSNVISFQRAVATRLARGQASVLNQSPTLRILAEISSSIDHRTALCNLFLARYMLRKGDIRRHERVPQAAPVQVSWRDRLGNENSRVPKL